jgi:hypothetical protein
MLLYSVLKVALQASNKELYVIYYGIWEFRYMAITVDALLSAYHE